MHFLDAVAPGISFHVFISFSPVYISSYHEDFIECTERALTSLCNTPAQSKICNVIVDKVVDNGLSLVCSKYKKGKGACAGLPELSTKNDSCAIGRGFLEPVIVIGENLG